MRDLLIVTLEDAASGEYLHHVVVDDPEYVEEALLDIATQVAGILRDDPERCDPEGDSLALTDVLAQMTTDGLLQAAARYVENRYTDVYLYYLRAAAYYGPEIPER